jgi:hypothetical protein
MEFHSATKKNEIWSFTSKWMELENIILRDVWKAISHVFSLVWNIDQLKIQKYYEKQVMLRGGHIQDV